MKFVGLHAHSDASIGDAIGKPKDHFDYVIANAGEDSMALAMTDHGNANSFGYMFQAKSEYKKKGLPFKPIFGVEAYYHPDLIDWQKAKNDTEKEKHEEQDLVIEVEAESKTKDKWKNPLNRRHHLVLIAQNQEGFYNLNRIVSWSYRHGFYRYPRVDFRLLEKYKEGLIVSTACLAGVPGYSVWMNHENGPEHVLEALDRDVKPILDLFGKDNAYLEVQFNKLPEQKLLNEYLIHYSKETGHKLLATGDSHYARPEWWREREMYKLLAQQSKGYNVSKDDLPSSIDSLKCELYPKNGEQMLDSYMQMYEDSDEETDMLMAEAIELSYKIAHEYIEDIKQDSTPKLPKSFLKEDPDLELEKICRKELSNKQLDNSVYSNRLDHELNVIKKKGMALYFLVLKRGFDEIKKELLVGAGRGSGAGSLVNYLLGITLIDPIKHNLLFERFISEARAEPPDIDSDLEDRDAGLDILRRAFGEENVIAISNYNSLQLKSLVKDISKLYSIPFEEVNAVTSVMEQEARQPILDSIGNDQKLYVFDFDGAIKYSPTFQAFMGKYPEVGESIKVLFRQNRAIGRHAGGTVITEDADKWMPIIRIRGVDQTPWGEGLTAKHLEPFGLIKYDFLGIATLRMIRRCIERILHSADIDPTFDNVLEFYNSYLHPDIIGDGSVEVFESIYHKGKFAGIFQFTESGAQNFCVSAKPTSIADIAAITSIYRPGPLKADADKKYVYLANNPEYIDLYHPIIEEVLGNTKGILCYQEQFMLLANKLAGFSLSESDELRKLLVKPITSMGDELKKKREEAGVRFVNGCVKNGISRDRAEILWDSEIMGFISYGFNASHAVSYAYLSYQCSWLLHNYPDEWVCSYLENDPDREKAISEVEGIGYKLGKLDFLISDKTYKVTSNIIYPPLSSVKGIGDAAIDELIETRSGFCATGDAASDFENLFFTTEHVVLKNGKTKTKKEWKFSKFNKRAMDALIKLEAFDSLQFVPNMFDNYGHFHRVLIDNWDKKDKQTFNMIEQIQATENCDWQPHEKIQFQKDLLGTYDKSLVLNEETLDALRYADILPMSDLCEDPRPIWFILNGTETKQTKNGKPYWKLSISDIDGKEYFLNYWFKPPEGGWNPNSIYYGILLRQDGFINTAKGEYLQKLKLN